VGIIKFLAAIAFIGSVIWFYAAPDYEPAIAIVTSFSALIGACLSTGKQKEKTSQAQIVQADGIGIQAGGDVNMGSITKGNSSDVR
jgi:hypothetical protein